MPYPPVEELLQRPDKARLLEVHRSMLSILSNMLWFFASVVVLCALTMFFGHLSLSDLPVLRHISVRWLAIVPVLQLLEIIRKYHDDLYVFGKHRLTHLNGRLSLSYSVPVIKYIDIRAVKVQQDIFGRIFNYGDVSVGTAAQDGNELILGGVRSPNALARLIEDMRAASLEIITAGGMMDLEQAAND